MCRHASCKKALQCMYVSVLPNLRISKEQYYSNRYTYIRTYIHTYTCTHTYIHMCIQCMTLWCVECNWSLQFKEHVSAYCMYIMCVYLPLRTRQMRSMGGHISQHITLVVGKVVLLSSFCFGHLMLSTAKIRNSCGQQPIFFIHK